MIYLHPLPVYCDFDGHTKEPEGGIKEIEIFKTYRMMN
jgi:hypothetical protein